MIHQVRGRLNFTVAVIAAAGLMSGCASSGPGEDAPHPATQIGFFLAETIVHGFEESRDRKRCVERGDSPAECKARIERAAQDEAQAEALRAAAEARQSQRSANEFARAVAARLDAGPPPVDVPVAERSIMFAWQPDQSDGFELPDPPSLDSRQIEE